MQFKKVALAFLGLKISECAINHLTTQQMKTAGSPALPGRS
jgi:hypothetical protein